MADDVLAGLVLRNSAQCAGKIEYPHHRNRQMSSLNFGFFDVPRQAHSLREDRALGKRLLERDLQMFQLLA